MVPLKAIVYVSVSTEPLGPGALERLLVEARDHNRTSGVTGVLLYTDGVFMQYFEGAAPAMQETYDRIRRSRLHTRLSEMMNEVIDRREFPDWQMALGEPSPSEMLALSTASWVIRHSSAGARPQRSVGLSLLRDFWQRRSAV